MVHPTASLEWLEFLSVQVQSFALTNVYTNSELTHFWTWCCCINHIVKAMT